jgi:hypothetical protein
VSDESERQRCSDIMRDAIKFVEEYPHKNPTLNKATLAALPMLIGVLVQLKSDIDKGRPPRTERDKQDTDTLTEIERAEEIIEGMR